jgi:hypothetical protein
MFDQLDRSFEVLQRVKKERNIVHTIKRRKATGLVTSCIAIALLKDRYKGRVYYVEEISIYWMTLRNKEINAGIWKRKH